MFREAKAKEMRALKNRSEAEQIAMVILNRQSQLKKWNKTETNFTRLITCSKMIIYAYFLAKIVNLFNDKFMVFFLLGFYKNIIIACKNTEKNQNFQNICHIFIFIPCSCAVISSPKINQFNC